MEHESGRVLWTLNRMARFGHPSLSVLEVFWCIMGTTRGVFSCPRGAMRAMRRGQEQLQCNVLMSAGASWLVVVTKAFDRLVRGFTPSLGFGGYRRVWELRHCRLCILAD